MLCQWLDRRNNEDPSSISVRETRFKCGLKKVAFLPLVSLQSRWSSLDSWSAISMYQCNLTYEQKLNSNELICPWTFPLITVFVFQIISVIFAIYFNINSWKWLATSRLLVLCEPVPFLEIDFGHFNALTSTGTDKSKRSHVTWMIQSCLFAASNFWEPVPAPFTASMDKMDDEVLNAVFHSRHVMCLFNLPKSVNCLFFPGTHLDAIDLTFSSFYQDRQDNGYQFVFLFLQFQPVYLR